LSHHVADAQVKHADVLHGWVGLFSQVLYRL
jgi:hypothetical protein